MEPFTIQCATCQSKLRVRDPHLIHQIVKCPKCDSMLQVEPPTRRVEVTRPREPDIDSMAVTKERVASSGVVPNKQVPADESPPFDFAADDDEFRLAEVEPPPRPTMHDTSAWQPAAAPLLPTEEWTSPTAAKSRQYLMIAFLGVSGIAVAGVLFFLFLRWYGSPSSSQLANAPPELAQQGKADQSGDATEEDSGNAAADDAMNNTLADDGSSDIADSGDEDTDRENTDRDIENLFSDGDAGRGMNGGENNSLDASGLDVTGESLDPGVATTQSPRPQPGDESAGTPAELDADLSAADPNQLDPTQLDPNPSADPDGDTLALPKQLADFAPLISYELQYVVPDIAVTPTQAPLTAEELGLDPNASAAAAPTIDVEQRLATQLPGLIIGSRSLSQAVNLWTHVSGVPTVVNFDSLAAAGIDRNSKVRVQQVEPKTLGQLGEQLAQAVGAELKFEGNRYLSIQASVEAMRKSLPGSLALSGLMDDEATAQGWLDAMIPELFPDLAGNWTLAGLELQANTESPAFGFPELQAWFELTRMFENWRQLQGGENLTGLSPDLLSQSLIDPQLLPGLDFELTGAFPQMAPVGQALSRTCELAGLECWVDWANVDQAGLSPESTFAVVTRNRSLRRVLGDYANHFGLVVALLDDHSLWLTSSGAYRQQSRIYVLESGGKSVEQWQQQLRLLTPVDEAGVGKLAVFPTPDGRHIIVRCCRPSIRF